jgi:hypothetical protein
MEVSNSIQKAMAEAMQLIQDGLRNELVQQGHRLTGGLADSMEITYSKDGETLRGHIQARDYAVYVDAGVAPNRVRYPIRVMIEYFILRGLPRKEATSAAYATRAVHRRDGIPSRGSYRYSLNGHRKGFISRGVRSVLDSVQDAFEKALGASVEVEIQSIFTPGREPIKMSLSL